MQHTMNPLDHLALVYGQGVNPPSYVSHPPIVSERSNGYTIPEADAYARRMADAAGAWLEHARERSRMKDPTLVSKALHSVAYSLRHRCHDFAVPSKLSGTSKTQPELWRLTRERAPFGTPLDVHEEGDGERLRLVVSYEGDVLGEVQAKHVAWLRPLVPFGAGLFLSRVTGHDESYTLGCNVVIGGVGRAVEALAHALGTDLDAGSKADLGANVGGDGIGGDGIGGDGVSADHVSGDGAAGPLRLISSAPSVAKPQADIPETDSPDEPDPDDVVLTREIDGTAKATVKHVVRHSPTGIEWGYYGSGPADLARSILSAFTDENTADRLYQRFKAEVIATVPKAGGVIRAADVRAWLAAQGAE